MLRGAGLILLLLAALALALEGDSDVLGLWRVVQTPAMAARAAAGRPHRSLTLELDVDVLKARLRGALRHAEYLEHRAKRHQGQRLREPLSATVTIPLPDGTFELVEVAEVQILEKTEFSEGYPEVFTYRAYGLEDDTLRGELDLTSSGFHAHIYSILGADADPSFGLMDKLQGEEFRGEHTAGAASARKRQTRVREHLFVEPDAIAARAEGTYHSFWKSQYRPPQDAQNASFVCHFDQENRDALRSVRALQRDAAGAPHVRKREVAIGDVQLRYFVAIAATGEYTRWQGGKTRARDDIITAINRVAGIYERDLSISLALLDRPDVIFEDPDTDPFSNDDMLAMLSQNQQVLASAVGVENFDVGHLFTHGGGGIATLQGLCSSSKKARGVTGTSTPTGDPFYVDYVAHEIAHQFGAVHTFNGVHGQCQGANRASVGAYEPGSGSTIMGYAGICGADNLQTGSDPYFHFSSIEFIARHTADVADGDQSCGADRRGGTSPPEIRTMTNGDHVVPALTAFALRASAIDPDSWGDQSAGITYCWEQSDLGPAGTAVIEDSSQDPGTGPIFRSFPPSSVGTRSFPYNPLSLRKGEIFPAEARTMTFVLTLRDGDGGIRTLAGPRVTVDPSMGPFAVSGVRGGAPLPGRGYADIFWDAGGTAYLSPTVSVYLVDDQGNKFAAARGIDNDGDGRICVDERLSGDVVVIVIEPDDGIFYAAAFAARDKDREGEYCQPLGWQGVDDINFFDDDVLAAASRIEGPLSSYFACVLGGQQTAPDCRW